MVRGRWSSMPHIPSSSSWQPQAVSNLNSYWPGGKSAFPCKMAGAFGSKSRETRSGPMLGPGSHIQRMWWPSSVLPQNEIPEQTAVISSSGDDKDAFVVLSEGFDGGFDSRNVVFPCDLFLQEACQR